MIMHLQRYCYLASCLFIGCVYGMDDRTNMSVILVNNEPECKLNLLYSTIYAQNQKTNYVVSVCDPYSSKDKEYPCIEQVATRFCGDEGTSWAFYQPLHITSTNPRYPLLTFSCLVAPKENNFLEVTGQLGFCRIPSPGVSRNAIVKGKGEKTLTFKLPFSSSDRLSASTIIIALIINKKAFHSNFGDGEYLSKNYVNVLMGIRSKEKLCEKDYCNVLNISNSNHN